MTHEKRSILVNDIVTVGADDFTVTLIVSRPETPAVERDMETIKAGIARLLAGWIKPKIQAGET